MLGKPKLPGLRGAQFPARLLPSCAASGPTEPSLSSAFISALRQSPVQQGGNECVHFAGGKTEAGGG